MKVKCIKLSVDNPNKFVINGEMKGYLKLNKINIVYGISFSKGIGYFYIFNDRHLIEVPMELFEVVDNSLPDNLHLKISEYGEITLYPELFYSEWFLDKFSDYEPEERRLFEELRLKMG